MTAMRHPVLAALYDALMLPAEWLGLRGQRARTAGAATGRVLEVGVGTGLSLPFYAHADEVVGIDPDPHMLRSARRRAAEARCPVRLVEASAQSLPFDDDEFDAVVMTLALCTIPDPDAAIREAARVLKPDGRLHFLEHVRSPAPGLGRVQDLATPVWSRLAGGCHPNRRSLDTIARHLEVEHLWAKGIMVQGTARPRAHRSRTTVADPIDGPPAARHPPAAPRPANSSRLRIAWPHAMFSKVLVANRGEIAVRVIRALDELGIASVAVYSEADRDAQHVRRATEAFLLGPGPAAESYLRVDKLLEAIEASGAEAVHPGYGFLAENAAFARALEEAGVTFIGPPASAIDAMGSKTKARELMQAAGVPIVPGTTEPIPTLDEARTIAEQIGYPVAVKAAGGGGGKGFRVALDPDKLEDAFDGAAREGEKFFSDARVYLERYLPDPRHVEVQILADAHGNVIHLGERDCSIQRRHQKLIEEAPAPLVDEALRARIGKIATEAALAVDYRGAGTIEGLLQDGEYFFLEMNTRVQVEHCVTEEVTGVDIVREQIRIAAGEPLSLAQEDVVLRGHSIECRINAEDASKNFAPAPGTVAAYREPAGPGVRIDSGVVAGSEITPLYDPMVAKLIVRDVDREAATRRMLRALDEFEIEGVRTLLPFHRAIMRSEQWARGETCRELVEDRKWLKALAEPVPEKRDEEAPELVARDYVVEVGSRRFEVKVHGEATAAPAAAAANGATRPAPRRERRAGGGGAGGDELHAPLQGNVFKVLVEKGAKVEEGALVCIIEAMKMENEITAHKAGVIADLPVAEGAAVSSGDLLAVIRSE